MGFFKSLKSKSFPGNIPLKKVKARKAIRHVLENKLQQLEDELTADQNNVSIEKYENVKAEFDQLYDYITEGSILRSKCDWYEHGKSHPSIFFTLRNVTKPNRV